MIKTLLINKNGANSIIQSNFVDNEKSKTGLYYKYDKLKFCKLNFIDNNKTEFKNYFKCVRDSFEEYEYNSNCVDYIIKKDNEYLYGNIQFIYENLSEFVGSEYTYLYLNKKYTKNFESDIVLRYIEIYCILNGIIQLINPLIEIDNVYELFKDIKSNVNTEKKYDIIGNVLSTKKDKNNFLQNGKYILSILNQSNNIYKCNMDYHYLFKITTIK